MPSASSAIVLVRKDGGRPLYAAAIDLTKAFELPDFGARPGTVIEAAYYRCSLAELRLDPGPLAILPGLARQRSLPLPKRAVRMTLAPNQSWSDEDESAIEPSLEALDPSTPLCSVVGRGAPVAYQLRVSMSLPESARKPVAHTLIALNATSALAQSETVSFFLRASRAGFQEVAVTLDGAPAPPSIESVYVSKGGKVFALERPFGRLYEGTWSDRGRSASIALFSDPTRPTFPIAIPRTGIGPSDLTGDPAGSEIFGWASTASSATSGPVQDVLGRFLETQQTWRTPEAGDGFLIGNVDEIPSQVVWVRAGEALASVKNAGCGCVVRYASDGVTKEQIPSEQDSATSVATSSIGELAGTLRGAVVANGPAGWRALIPTASAAGTPITALDAVGDGFVFGTGDPETGTFGEYSPSFGFCPVQNAAAAGRVIKIVALDGGTTLVVLSQRATGANTLPIVSVLERTPPPACLGP
jgi:hypothetical protein